MSGRAWRIYLVGGLAGVALYFLLPLEGLWSNLAYDLIGLSSVAAILIAVRRHRPARSRPESRHRIKISRPVARTG